ncbi:MAG: MFS transporter [Deltaproteobacteria bacterium]|nr:MFS transporter [Deltaproteobacteria bacterium]
MANINKWNPEDNSFWESAGKKIANRNLWISIPNLLLAFAVWIMWSMVIVQMENLGFTFVDDPNANKALLYTLPAIAGLSGATLRIPNSFLIAVGGGRNVVFLTSILLFIPAIGAGIALQDINTPYLVFAFLAATSGFGGGNFASSMSNISFFFPKRVQGTALGLNAGLGNLGVSVMQFLLPVTMGMAIFGAIGGDGIPLPKGLSGKAAGTLIFIQNAGWTWVPFLIAAVVACWFGMNNLKSATPNLGSAFPHLIKTAFLVTLGVISSAIGCYLLLALKLNMWIVLPITIFLCVMFMKFLSPGQLKENLNKQFAIFKNKHNWIMTIIYTMTFGSFIGYASAFPKLIQDVFGYLPDGSVNPVAPSPMKWAWMGPFLGAIIRPVGGWISDKVQSGSRVTAWSTVMQVVGALGAAYFIVQARGGANPTDYWIPFLLCFLLLFMGSGIGNGSTFRSVPYIFEKAQAGPVLGWTSAVAAYGAFIIPKVFGEQIANKTPQYALYGFAVYYMVCLILNWWYYDRKNAEIKC